MRPVSLWGRSTISSPTRTDPVTGTPLTTVRLENFRDGVEDYAYAMLLDQAWHQLRAADLPSAWNEKYQKYLGITPPDNRSGVLQDVHWSAGLIGYFPTYSLGNLYAAQFFAQAKADVVDLEGAVARGDFQPLLAWLREKIHRHGQRWSAAELVERGTGRPLSAEPLVAHLRAKLGPLYGL